MTNKLFFILFLGISINTYSQKKYIKNYYNNSILKEEGWTINKNKTAFWSFYHKNGTIKKRGHFKDNQPAKYWYFYREDGSKIKEGHFLNGKKNNWWIFYDKDGNINRKCQLKGGLRDGYCLLYKKKKLVKASQYSNDKKVKEWTDFYSFKKENNLNDLK